MAAAKHRLVAGQIGVNNALSRTAAYCGMPEVRFHSGGTAPTAFNIRTVNTLKEIGVEVGPTV